MTVWLANVLSMNVNTDSILCCDWLGGVLTSWCAVTAPLTNWRWTAFIYFLLTWIYQNNSSYSHLKLFYKKETIKKKKKKQNRKVVTKLQPLTALNSKTFHTDSRRTRCPLSAGQQNGRPWEQEVEPTRKQEEGNEQWKRKQLRVREKERADWFGFPVFTWWIQTMTQDALMNPNKRVTWSSLLEPPQLPLSSLFHEDAEKKIVSARL